MLFISHFFTYWTLSIFLYISDLIVYKYNIVEKYKHNKINQNYWKYCHDSMKSSLLNQLFITYPVITFMNRYIYFNNYNYLVEISKFIFYVICADIWFFSLHILCHKIPILYSFHKYHHRISSTSAVSALDAHPIEHLIINLGAVTIGPYLWIGNIKTIYLWIILTTLSTCLSHSGYKHFLMGTQHNTHHIMSKYNYGQGTYILDRILKTYR